MLRTLLTAIVVCGVIALARSSAQAQAEPRNPVEDAVRRNEAGLQARRAELDANRQRLMAELKEVEANLQRFKTLIASRREPTVPAEREAFEREAAEIQAKLAEMAAGRAKLEQMLKEIEVQLKALSVPRPEGVPAPRRVSADERLRQRLAEYARSVAKLRADGNEAAAQRLEEEANEFARQNGERTRVEVEVMRTQAAQMRASGRAAEAAQLEKAIQARTEAVAAADRAEAEFRPSPGDGPARPRPMSNVDQLSREAIVRRISHFRQAMQHLQEVGRGEIVEQLQREIDRLENRLAAIDAAAVAPPAGPEIARLQGENEQLRREVEMLKRAVDQLTEALKKVAPPPQPIQPLRGR